MSQWERGCLVMVMGSMRDSILLRNMDKGYIGGRMGPFMKGSGLKIVLMGLEVIFGRMGEILKVNGLKI